MIAKNEQIGNTEFNYNKNSVYFSKHGQTSSSNNSNSNNNNSQSNNNQMREEKNSKYRLRVSFQKCSTFNSHLNHALDRNKSLHSTESHQILNSKDKVNVYFNKNKSKNLQNLLESRVSTI
jgi:hypothetical protein